ncbi:MAG: hypothetical protein ACOY3K_07045 [Candidatus Omnitrophota bacterium]
MFGYLPKPSRSWSLETGNEKEDQRRILPRGAYAGLSRSFLFHDREVGECDEFEAEFHSSFGMQDKFGSAGWVLMENFSPCSVSPDKNRGKRDNPASKSPIKIWADKADGKWEGPDIQKKAFR